MTEKEIHKEFEPIKAMFETGKITQMKQLDKLSPTKLSKLLRINYGRYIEKLYNPELFAIHELKSLAGFINIDLEVIGNIVIKEVKRKSKAK